MDNEYYDKFFGEKVTISIYPSHEPVKKSNWMLYTCNSISSIAYISNAILFFIFCNTLCIISYLGAILSFLLGIASFFWWASQRDYVQRIDVGLYSSLIFWPGCMKLSYNNPDIEFTITNIYFALTIALTYICYDLGVSKFHITFLNIIGLMFSIGLIATLNNRETEFIFFYSILLILLGFLLKLCDTFKILNPNKFGSGTGWFHLFTALGLLVVWYGFQLLPSNKNHMIL
jgi:hypothetical protein